MDMGPSLLQSLAVGSWRLAVGGGSRLVAVGGGWRLAVGGPWGLSLRAVLSKKKIGFLRTALPFTRRWLPLPWSSVSRMPAVGFFKDRPGRQLFRAVKGCQEVKKITNFMAH